MHARIVQSSWKIQLKNCIREQICDVTGQIQALVTICDVTGQNQALVAIYHLPQIQFKVIL